MPKPNLAERFWRCVDRRGEAECWPWTGATNRLGYGTIGRGPGKHDRAHRVSYEVNVGPITDGLHVLHSCDNRACVNPAHLRLGTHADNMRDRKERGRVNAAQGESAHTAKLTAEKVLAIRAKYAAGTGSFALAREYGITPSNVWHITTRRTWRHV